MRHTEWIVLLALLTSTCHPVIMQSGTYFSGSSSGTSSDNGTSSGSSSGTGSGNGISSGSGNGTSSGTSIYISSDSGNASICERLYSASNPNNKTVLHIVLVAPFPSKEDVRWDGGHSLIPSGLLAIEQMNNRSDILPNYHLQPLIVDGGCNLAIKAVQGILRNVVHRSPGTNILGVVGPACSEGATALGPLMKKTRIQLPMVTIANDPKISSRSLNPFTFGIVSTATEYARTGIKLFEEQKSRGMWDQVAVLYEGDRDYNLALFREFDTLARENISPESTFTAPLLSYYMPLDQVVLKGIRTIFVFSARSRVCRLMCLAYEMEMFHPLYQFIFTDRRLRDFETCPPEDMEFMFNTKIYNCTMKNILTVANGSILLHYNLESLANDKRAFSGYTHQEYSTAYQNHRSIYNNCASDANAEYSPWASPYYDAVWAVGLAANKTLPNLQFNSQLNVWKESDIFDAFYSLNFSGVSTTIQFNESTGFLRSGIDISQINVTVNETDEDENLLAYDDYLGYFYSRNISEKVLNQLIRSSFEKRTEKVYIWLIALVYGVTFFMILIVSFYHILHIIFRNRPSIRATSPKLNHFIFIGCYLLLVSVALSTTNVGFTPSKDTYLAVCYTEFWLQSIGVAFIFGTLLVKYYRLYLVFTHPYNHRINLSNMKLSLGVMGIVALDILFLSLGSIFHPLKIYSETRLEPTNPPVRIETRVCVLSSVGEWFNGASFAYSALLILIVVVLSIFNRHIRKEDFNTTLTTNILVYLYAIMLGILLPSMYINADQILLKYGLSNLVYLVFTVLCLILLFTPPLLSKKRRRLSIAYPLRNLPGLVFVTKSEKSSL